ncbi:MAG: DeoR/GlpR family DNA-binding transcription regulator [Erysipelotrichaceae bacterium]|nr:DeoR/GlpR family DNA-binding transcription regulator [Erysipelotrichaceae bacterium]
MKQIKRWKEIMTLLQQEGFLTVEQLAERLDVSLATIRRDLTALDEDKAIIRTRGGAKARIIETEEPSMKSKALQNSEQKEIVARYAASLIKDGDFVCMDSGSTTYQIIQYITAQNLTVVTNGVYHVQALIEKGISTFMVGGEVKEKTCATVGSKTLEQLDNFNFDIAFVGANGVSLQAGFTTHEVNEAEVKRKILDRSSQKYILADSTKLNHQYFISFYPLNGAIMITEKRIEFDYSKCKVLIVSEAAEAVK